MSLPRPGFKWSDTPEIKEQWLLDGHGDIVYAIEITKEELATALREKLPSGSDVQIIEVEFVTLSVEYSKLEQQYSYLLTVFIQRRRGDEDTPTSIGVPNLIVSGHDIGYVENQLISEAVSQLQTLDY